MAENILKKLVNNSQIAIDDGVYDVDVNLKKSDQDFKQIITSNPHATLLTEVKFSSPSLGKIRTIGDPAVIAKQMIAGGSKALSILTDKRFFGGNISHIAEARRTVSLPLLRKRFNIPIVGVVRPGARKAASMTRNNKIGVIGTSTTIRSGSYEKEIRRISKAIKVISQACPLFVPLVEEGWLNGNITLDIARKYLEPIARKKIDTLVLGCTHYPLLKYVISQVLGQRVKIVDSASSVAEEVACILRKAGLSSNATKRSTHRFFATDAVEQFAKVGEKFLGREINNVRRAEVG